MPKGDATLAAASVGSQTQQTCCGKRRGSAFCPDCGKKLHPLVSLLMYCQQHAGTAHMFHALAIDEHKAALEEARELGKDPPRRHPAVRRTQKRLFETAGNKARWDGWVSGLKAAIGEGA